MTVFCGADERIVEDKKPEKEAPKPEKVEAPAPDEQQTAETQEDVSSEGVSIADIKPKRRRGRPKKAAAESEA